MGKLADLVLWDPASSGFARTPVLKGGMIAWAAMGDANASIPTPQPVLPRPMFGAVATAGPPVAFVAQAAMDDGLAERLGLVRELVAVATPRRGKAHMVNDATCPASAVDPDTFAVRIDGELMSSAGRELPMAQRYFLF